MKGIQVKAFGGPDVLEYTDLPDPTPENDQVLIQVKGASINFADIKARSGGYHFGKKPPYVPGIDVAGIVLDTGPDVQNIKPGDRVIAFPFAGSYAEKTLAREILTFKIPESIGFETAAACPIVLGTATHMIFFAAQMQKGETLLVHAAAGGVGSTAIQAASSLAPSIIIGSTGSEWKREKIREIGASKVIDYNDDYSEAVMSATQGKGVDVVLNPLGGRALAEDLKCLAPFGRIMVFGNLLSSRQDINTSAMYGSNQLIRGVSFGHIRKNRPEIVKETMDKGLSFITDGNLDVKTADTFPLKEASRAHDVIEQRKAAGKIILIPDD